MTAHHDVAGVVERLRSNPHGLIHVDTRAGINEPTNMIRDAATLIESISKALSEAEAKLSRSNHWLKRYQADDYLNDDDCEELDALIRVTSTQGFLNAGKE